MKKIRNLAACLCACALLFSACGKDEKQTSVKIDDVKTSAKIMGVVKCNAGQAYENGMFVEKTYVPADKKVYVEVPYAAYDPTGTATGVKVFSTAVNADGTYEIEFPLIPAAAPTAVQVFVEPFIVENQEFDKMVDGAPTFKSVKKLYTTPKTPVFATANNTVSRDYATADFVIADAEPQDEFETSVTLSGKVGVAAEVDTLGRRWVYTDGIDVIVTVTYNIGKPDEKELEFGTTTANGGVWKLKIPVQKEGDALNFTVKSVSKITDNFKHYNTGGDEITKTLKGIYESATTAVFIANPVYINDVANYIGDGNRLMMYFSMFEGEDEGNQPYDKTEWNAGTSWKQQ